MKLLTLALVLAFAASLEAASNCMWGPSYWCKSRETAKECQQTRYCQDSVWKGSEVSVEKENVGSIQCTICQIVVQVVDQKLQDNATESEVEAALDTVCSELGGLSGTCQELVKNYFPQIWQALVDKLSPDQVCDFLNLCSSSRNKLRSYGARKLKGNAGSMKKMGKVGSTECNVCKLVVEYVEQQFLNNSTEEKVQEALETFCGSLGVLGGTCKSLVDQYFPQIWSYIVSGATPDTICTQIGLCNSTKVSLKFKSLLERSPRLGGLECDVCKGVARKMMDMVNSSASEEAIKDALLLACNYMGGFAPVCRSLVDKEWPEIFTNIMKIVAQPEQLCVIIKMCTSQQALMAPQQPVCDLCKLATTFMKSYVDSNTTEAEVKDAVDSLCNILPGAFGDECKSLIDEYFSQFWDLLKQEVDTGAICVQLGLCNSTKTLQLIKKPMPQAIPCDICKLATTFLKPYVDSNSTEQEVKAAVEQVCNLLPNAISSECSSLINQYFDLIWDLLKQEVDTGVICVQLGLCNSTKTTQLLKRTKMVPQASTCDLCKTVVAFLKTYVDQNSTETEVKNAVEAACALLPGDLSTECSSVVKEYFPLIWALVKGEVDSGEICNQLGLCNSTMALLKKNLKVSPQQFTCPLCQAVSKELKTLMDRNNSEQEVQTALKKMCSMVPGSLGNNCTAMVNKYFLLGWVVMKQLVDAGTFCGYVKMCNSSGSLVYLKELEVSRVGDEECSVCKLVVETVKNIFDDNKTLNETEKLMEEVCPYIVGFSSQCKKIIEMYLPQIWQYLESKMDPTEICEKLNLCQSFATIQLKAKSKPTKVKGVIECLVCTEAMKELVSLLDNNSTRQDIIAALDKVCDLLPKVGNECKSIMDDYADKIIDLILSGVAPREICKMIALCTSAQRQPLTSASGMECTVCKEVLTFAKTLIGSQTAESEISKVLEEVCDLVSSGIKSECQSFISTFGPQLIELLAKAIEPDVICREIKLCTSSSIMEPWGRARKY